MAVFHAFRALRPTPQKASAVAALPYDVVSRREARKMGEKNPDSFLHVDRAEMDLDPEISLYDPRVYAKAKENLLRMEREGTLVMEEEPCFYIYELVQNGRSQSGLVGCASIDDYIEGRIKKHELTREEKEADRIRHVDACDANTGPIYLTCQYTEPLTALMEEWKRDHSPVYDFQAEDGVLHRVWVIKSRAKVQEIQKEFERISSIYIADGHHRAASAVKVGLKRRQENPGYCGEEEFNFFLSVVFPFEQMTILPYNRVVKGLNGLTAKAFLGGLRFHFELMVMSGFPCRPVEKHCMGLYVEGCWYHLRAWPDVYEGKDRIGQLDVEILQKKVLSPILGISDPRTDERLQFVGGSCGLKELAAMADESEGAVFVMYPTSLEDLTAIADQGGLMPPKSTWFEPKLRSGLFIHKLS